MVDELEEISWRPSAMFAFDGTLAIEIAVSLATNCSQSVRLHAVAPAAPPSTTFSTLELLQNIVQHVMATPMLEAVVLALIS